MNDDWTEPTGEREPFADTPTQEHVLEGRDALARLLDLEGVSEQDIRIVDAYFQELALEASEDDSPPTPAEQEDLDAIASFVDSLSSAPDPTTRGTRHRS